MESYVPSNTFVWTGEYGTFPRVEEHAEVPVIITGLDKRALLHRLVYLALEDSNYDANEEIDTAVINGPGYIDRIAGVAFKADFSVDEVNSYYYNKYVGKKDEFESIVREMRAEVKIKVG